MEEDFKISEEDEKELEKISAEVSSLEHYIFRSLPRAEKGLTQIVKKLRNGETPIDKDKVMAIIYRSIGRNAQDRYSTELIVNEYMERLQKLYIEVASYFPEATE